MTDRHVILAAVEHEIRLTRREIAKFSALTGVGALLATVGLQIGQARPDL